MAAGDGFRQVPLGFDKNEVNAYISDLRKKMSALESEMRTNNEKTKAAEKLAEEADSRINAARSEADKKVEEISSLLEEEKSTTKRQIIEIRNLKERIDAEKKKMTDMLKNGKGVSAEATRAFNEVIEKANEEAADIIDKANAQAAEIIAAANKERAAAAEKTEAFLAALRQQIETMTNGFNAVNSSAAELLGAAAAPVFSAPQPVTAEGSAPSASVETPAAVEEPEEAPAANEPEESPAEELSETDEPAEEPSADEPAETPAEEPADEPAETPAAEEDAPAVFDDWSGSDMADAIAAAEKKMAEENKQDIPLVNPDSGSDPFGGMFDMSESHDDMSGFDMEDHADEPEQIEYIKPLDVSDHAEASFNRDFSKDLLAQTMPSSSLTDADEDLLAAVRAAEEAAAVVPNDVSDIDMDEKPESFSGSEEDDLMKALREAEAAFGGTEYTEAAEEGAEEGNAVAADPWAELQNQLKAMESANGASSAITYDSPEPQEEEQSAAPPSADDSSIWDFGGGSAGGSSDDDDMSSDFGGFGGF